MGLVVILEPVSNRGAYSSIVTSAAAFCIGNHGGDMPLMAVAGAAAVVVIVRSAQCRGPGGSGAAAVTAAAVKFYRTVPGQTSGHVLVDRNSLTGTVAVTVIANLGSEVVVGGAASPGAGVVVDTVEVIGGGGDKTVTGVCNGKRVTCSAFQVVVESQSRVIIHVRSMLLSCNRIYGCTIAAVTYRTFSVFRAPDRCIKLCSPAVRVAAGVVTVSCIGT